MIFPNRFPIFRFIFSPFPNFDRGCISESRESLVSAWKGYEFFYFHPQNYPSRSSSYPGQTKNAKGLFWYYFVGEHRSIFSSYIAPSLTNHLIFSCSVIYKQSKYSIFVRQMRHIYTTLLI